MIPLTPHPLKEEVDTFKKLRILTALHLNRWRRNETAAYLCMTREGLYKLIKHYDLEKFQ